MNQMKDSMDPISTDIEPARSNILHRFVYPRRPGEIFYRSWTLKSVETALVKANVSAILEFEHPSETPLKLMVFPKHQKELSFCETEYYSIQYMGGTKLSAEHAALIKAVRTIICFNENNRNLEQDLLSRLTVTTRPLKEIVTTKKCNQKCLFCNLPPSSPHIVEDPGEIRRLLREWKRMGIQDIQFGGREATLRPELKDHLSYARRCGFKTLRLATNGTQITSRRRAAEIREAGVDEFLVSLHTHDPKISETLTRTSGDFYKTLNAVNHLAEIEVPIYLSFVINKINYRYMPEYGEFIARTFGAEAVTQILISFITPFFRAWRNRDIIIPSVTEIKPFLSEFLKNNKKTKLNISIPDYCGIPPCVLPRHHVVFEEAHSINNSGLSGDKIKFKECAACTVNGSCSGMWTRYIDMYGESEFSGRLVKSLNKTLTSCDSKANEEQKSKI